MTDQLRAAAQAAMHRLIELRAHMHTGKEREVMTTAIGDIESALAADKPADKAQDAQQCRSDGRCQYAIDYGAEGLGHCPKGKCCMPGNELKNSARYEYLKSLDYAQVTYIVEHSPDKWDAKIDADMQGVKP